MTTNALPANEPIQYDIQGLLDEIELTQMKYDWYEDLRQELYRDEVRYQAKKLMQERIEELDSYKRTTLNAIHFAQELLQKRLAYYQSIKKSTPRDIIIPKIRKINQDLDISYLMENKVAYIEISEDLKDYIDIIEREDRVKEEDWNGALKGKPRKEGDI